MEGSVLSFLKSEWKVSDTGSAHWASSYLELYQNRLKNLIRTSKFKFSFRGLLSHDICQEFWYLCKYYGYMYTQHHIYSPIILKMKEEISLEISCRFTCTYTCTIDREGSKSQTESWINIYLHLAWYVKCR
jgi:hypothetical protein